VSVSWPQGTVGVFSRVLSNRPSTGRKGYAMNALNPLGMVSELPSSNQMQSDTERTTMEVQKDYFVEKDGQKFAGMHLLVDLWGASNLCDPDHIDQALREAAEAAGATILHGHFHHFSPNGGVSGVLVLAESHISIHTWPERDFAAIDIFMCGACNPYDSVDALKAAFQPRTINLGEQRRGLIT
jgi:S-adenosylmethionine decarboxylase